MYRNSYITLAALHAKNSNAGLFTNLDTEYQSKIVDVRHAGQNFELYARQLVKGTCVLHSYLTGGYDSDPDSEPLMQRAWTFQERLISPRTIFFGHHGLIWECFTHVGCECHRDNWSGLLYTARTLKQELKFMKLGSAKDIIDVRQAWHTLVSSYTHCRLTKPTDRLIAIGGLAKDLAISRTGEAYLAGLWSGSFLEDLLWITTSSRTNELTIGDLIEAEELSDD